MALARTTDVAAGPSWQGRFPRNDIISLLDVNRRFNLAESTSQDLSFGELLDLVGLEAVRDLRLGYGSAQGSPQLRAEIGGLTGVSPETVLTTQGTALALYLLAVELCRPGDEALLFTPCFPPSRDTLLGAGVVVREVPLRFEDGFRVDLARFEGALTPGTKLVSIATPQNPSGVSTSVETIDAMLEIMARKAPGAMLFVDETYRYATYGDASPAPSFADHDPRIISAASVSKAFGAPGLRVGWLTTGDAALRDRLMTAKMNIVISGSPLDETLAAHLIDRREVVLAPRRALLARAIEEVADWRASEADRIEWVRPDGGALCCMRLRSERFDEAAVARFWAGHEERGLQLASGTWFGAEARTFRLGFGYLPPETLPRALALLSGAMIAAETANPTRSIE
ncbi:MAG: pyridoxal phosphate-dependent aminotransferase [Pseudomonadota bacterium]